MQLFDYFEVVHAMVFLLDWVFGKAGVHSQPYLRYQLTELNNGHKANLLIPY